VSDVLDDILARAQRVSSDVKHMVEATGPDREAKVGYLFLKACVDPLERRFAAGRLMIARRPGQRTS
jgi:hypothetical protein